MRLQQLSAKNGLPISKVTKSIEQELKEIIDTYDWNDDIPLDESILELMSLAYNLALGQSTVRKPVLQLSLLGNVIIKRYPKGINSTKADGFDPSCIRRVIAGRYFSHKGFSWAFEADY